VTPFEEIAPIADVLIDVAVELDRKLMSIHEIVSLDVQSVIQMPRSAGENIDVYVGGALVGSGEIVIIETIMGFRITDFHVDE
jgi:flagellar motor switch protein FliN/FliY